MADDTLPPPPPGFTGGEPPPPPGYKAVAAPGILESMGRGAVEGATFGFDNKLGMDKERRELSRATNPWAHFFGELVGGAAPMTAAYLLPTGAGQAAAAGRTAQLATQAAGLARTALVPSEIGTLGQAAAQGLKLGTTYGGLSGAGHADVKPDDSMADALSKRALGAGAGMMQGAVAGPALGVIGHGVFRGAQKLGGMKAAADAEVSPTPIPGQPAGQPISSGAITTYVKNLERDRLSPQDMIDNILGEFPSASDVAKGGMSRRYWGPTDARQPWTRELVEDVVAGAAKDKTPSQIAADLAAKMNGSGPGKDAIGTLLGELEDRHLGPLNPVDRASMIRPGAGENTQMTMRGAAATPGEHVGIARENLLERQLEAGPRINNTLARALGSPDFEEAASTHRNALNDAGTRLYGEAFAEEKPFDLTKTFSDAESQFDRMRGVIPDTMRKRLNDMMWSEKDANGQIVKTPPQSLQSFMYAREGMRDLIGELPQGNNLRRHLTEFYNKITNEVGQSNPKWLEANRVWQEGKAGENAMEAGAAMTTRLNSKNRANLQELTSAEADAAKAQEELRKAHNAITGAPRRAATPAELASATPEQQAAVAFAQARLEATQSRQELFKVGFLRALSDMLANQGETNNLTRQLLLPGAKQMLKQILGKDADQVLRVLQAERAMHRTYSSQFGSQTTPLREKIDEMNWAPKYEAAWGNLGLGKILQLAQEYAARHINTRRNTDLMKIYTETDPLKQLEFNRAAQNVHAARSRAGNLFGKPIVSSSGPVLDAILGTEYGSPPAKRP